MFNIKNILVAGVVFWNFQGYVQASELKVFDQLGLERAFAKINEHGTVQVVVETRGKALPESITLNHVDGLSPDKQLNSEWPNNSNTANYKSQNVGPGSWKIILSDPAFVVKEVQIIK